MDRIEEGDFVRVPQKVTLMQFDDWGSIKSYYLTARPLAAIYLGEEKINGEDKRKLLIENELWYALPEDIQTWREYANKNDRSI